MRGNSPAGFVWGAATSAFQIEGAPFADGKGESIWDRFVAQGRLHSLGAVGCDHYHRWEEDLDLLAELGVDAYRFSIAWTRVIPNGDDEVNRTGLAFYRRLAEGMRTRGITPYPTLYHWDLPQSLQDRGGWANRATIDSFARYAGVVADELGDLVTDWITHNEPWVATMLGHQQGLFAPGVKDWPTALTAGHHILVSHGRATRAIRESVPDARVGIALDCRPARPASDRDEDHAASSHFDGYRNRWFFDPVFGLGYPDDMVRSYVDLGRLPGGLAALVADGDLELISAPIDFLGLNYYTTIDVSFGSEESEASDVAPSSEPPTGYTEMGWRIDPIGLSDYLGRIHEEYRFSSVIITENGASYSDGPDDHGVIDDQRRIDYLAGHIDAVIRARSAGVPVNGYFVWSLLDNIEWLHGFSQRFGIVWVDEDSGGRRPKESFHWYADAIRSTIFDDMRELTFENADDTGAAEDPAVGRLEAWMDGYVQAWTDNDPDRIAGLFAPGAVYDPQTADGELHGIEEIVRWWQDIDDDPDNWDFEWRPLVETDEIGVVVGAVRYLDPPASFRNLWVIRFDPDGRCSDFTEWYIEEEA